MESEKKVARVTKSQIESWIREGVTKDKGSPNYNPVKGSLLEKLKCKQNAVKTLFEKNKDLQDLYMTVNYRGGEKADVIEFEDETSSVINNETTGKIDAGAF